MNLFKHFSVKLLTERLYNESKGLYISIGLFQRSDKILRDCDLLYRFNLLFGFGRSRINWYYSKREYKLAWMLFLLPAWREEPTVVAEYKRTMEAGCETPSVRWKRLQEQEASLPSARQGTQTLQHNFADPWSAEDLVRSLGEETIEGRFLRRGLDRWGMGIAKRDTAGTSSS